MNNSFETLINTLSEGDVINFSEYKLDRHEKRKLTLKIDNAIIKEVFPANETINRDKLTEIYGEELDDSDYLALSYSTCPRYLLNLGVNKEGKVDVKMITLNKDFYDVEQQTIELVGNINAVDEPSYVMSQQGGW